MKKLFLKVYQTKHLIDSTYFIERVENLPTLLEAEESEFNENEDYLPFVFEPVFMTEEEFNNLPEFTGF